MRVHLSLVVFFVFFAFFSYTSQSRLRDPLFKSFFITFETAPTAGGFSKSSFCPITHPQLSRPLHANATLMQKALNLTSAVNCFDCSYFYSCGQLLRCSILRSSRELDSRRSDSTPHQTFLIFT